MEGLREAIANGDRAVATRGAHTLRSVDFSIGAWQLQHAAEPLERYLEYELAANLADPLLLRYLRRLDHALSGAPASLDRYFADLDASPAVRPAACAGHI